MHTHAQMIVTITVHPFGLDFHCQGDLISLGHERAQNALGVFSAHIERAEKNTQFLRAYLSHGSSFVFEYLSDNRARVMDLESGKVVIEGEAIEPSDDPHSYGITSVKGFDELVYLLHVRQLNKLERHGVGLLEAEHASTQPAIRH